MRLNRLKLSGFKSFVDATELRIETGLTGIVGPNGCGKSNLLEAIRWVMGEASARAMRGGGMEDVIFAGTATRPQRDFAEVSLSAVRDPDDALPGFDIGADGEIEIIRRIERGAGSAYRANGRDVRAKDIALLFADAATGAHSPALVSQGKIAAVIAARPQERRLMLEEAAGIAGLHVRRKDAEQKLRAAESNLARLDEILADMDVRAGALRRQARAAERYTRLSEHIRLAEARLLYLRWKEAAQIAEAAEAEAKAAEAAVSSAQEAQNASAAHVQAALDAVAQARAKAQTIRDSASDAAHRLASLRAERDGLERRIAELAEQAQRIEQDKEREGALAHDAVEATSRLSEETAALKARIAQDRAAMPHHNSRMTEARDAARDAELALAKAMAEQASEQAELRVADAAVSAAQSRYERATRTAERLAEETARLPDPSPIQDERDAMLEQIASAQSAMAAANSAIVAHETAREDAANARALAEADLSTAKAMLAALDGEAAALSQALKSGKNDTKSRIVDAMRAEPGYEHALAAALGDDLEAASDPDDSAYWLGADVQAGDPALPKGTTALAAYVSAPPALARRLAQIAVAEQDDGQPLAVGQRLVTRVGAMRRWDGFVAREAGASTAQRLVRLNRLAAIDHERPTLQTTVEQAQSRFAESDAALNTAAENLAHTQKALAEATTRLGAAERKRDDLEAQLQRIASRSAEAQTQATEAHEEAATMEAELAAARAARSALNDGMETRAKVEALQAVSEQARSTVSQLQAEITMAERTLASQSERLSAAEAELKSWRARSGEAERRIADMLARAQALASEQASIADAPERLSHAISQAQEISSSLTTQAEELRTTESAMEAELRAAEQRHNHIGEELARAREQRAGNIARAEGAQERRREHARTCGERFECPPAVLPEKIGFDSSALPTAAQEQTELDQYTADRERLGPVNLVAARELVELETQQETSRAESAELIQAINQLRGSIGNLNREGRSRLLAAFEAVDGHFRRLFTALFNGGQARLELIDSDDPLEAGLEILAQPPGKKLSTLTLLSGGEQALTAVALIFGLFLTNPAPICVLDEVDAPLDDANVERFCDLLDQMVEETSTRYLIVTHNAVTMSRMHRLFGVTMVEQGISRLVSVDLGGAEQLLAAE